MHGEPLRLSALLIQRYNQRDLEGMLELFAHDVEFVRPGANGPVVLRGRAAVAERYAQDWSIFEHSHIAIARAVVDGADVAAEIRMTLRREGTSTTAEGAVFHSWEGEEMRRYRAYLDLPPL